MNFIILFIAFISLFALPVFFHELGHFIFSKLAGIKVYEFSIGLPFIPHLKTIFEYKETQFTLKIIPIGGFISYTPKEKELESIYEFLKYPGWRRLIATLGGPVFNFIFALLVITVVMINGTFSPSLIIDGITNKANIDLQKGDTLLAMNDQKINDWEKIKEIVTANNQKPIKILYNRQGKTYTTEIASEFNTERQEIELGIIPLYTYQKYSLPDAFKKSISLSKKIIYGFFSLIKKIFRGQGSVKDFSGPVGIAKISNKAMAKGNKTYWLLLAFFSINLGIINLIPLPSLDGGQIIAYSIEAITGKSFSLKTHQIFGAAGLIILILVMLLVMYSDIITL